MLSEDGEGVKHRRRDKLAVGQLLSPEAASHTLPTDQDMLPELSGHMDDESSCRRIVLGSAAFGQAYGISNLARTMAYAELGEILATAWSHGIRRIDTAPAYGRAEARIGKWMRDTGNTFAITSKLPPLDALPDRRVDEAIRDQLDRSMNVLGIAHFEGYLLHGAGDILREPVQETLTALKREGRLGFRGLSAYTPAEVVAGLETGAVDVVQVPVNVFDSRFRESGVLECCRAAGVHVLARSIFLQGLFFRAPEELPAFFAPIAPALRDLRTLADEAAVDIAHLALAYVLETYSECDLVVGCYRASELAEICSIVAASSLDSRIVDRLYEIGRTIPEALVDPRAWPKSA